jgi:hypothetical protein
MNKLKIYFPIIFLFLFLFVGVRTTHAFSFGDVVDGIKDFFTPDPPKELTIDSKIELAPGGDVDKNGQIDSGDIIRFKYTLKNPTENEYSWLTINTKINRRLINYIHNDYGITSLDDDGKTLKIPHIRVYPKQEINIRFDAMVNYSSKQDILLSTEPDLVDKNNKVLLKLSKREITAKKITVEKISEMTKQGIKEK